MRNPSIQWKTAAFSQFPRMAPDGQYLTIAGFVEPTLCTTLTVQRYIVHLRPACLFLVVHKVVDAEYSRSVAYNEHANQASQCSSVPTFGGAQ